MNEKTIIKYSVVDIQNVLNLLNRNEEINGIDKDDIPYIKNINFLVEVCYCIIVYHL